MIFIIIIVIFIVIVDQDLATPREGRVQEIRPGTKVGGDVTTQRVPQAETLQRTFELQFIVTVNSV